MNRAEGIDISFWESIIDWTLLSKAIDFLWIKTSEDNFIDKMFQTHRANARMYGKPWGGYHFWRANPSYGGIKQAELLVTQLGNDVGQLPPMFDFEDIRNSYGEGYAWQSNQAQIFCNRIEALIGKRPVIYTGSGVTQPYGKLLTWMNAYDGWLAQYPWSKRTDFVQNYTYLERQAITTKFAPILPATTTIEPSLTNTPFTKWMLWQFTGNGRKPGLPGDVDVEVYNGTIDDMAKQYGFVSIPTPVPETWEVAIDGWARKQPNPYTGISPS